MDQHKIIYMEEGDSFVLENCPSIIKISCENQEWQLKTPNIICWTKQGYSDFLNNQIPLTTIQDLGLFGFLKIWFQLKTKGYINKKDVIKWEDRNARL